MGKKRRVIDALLGMIGRRKGSRLFPSSHLGHGNMSSFAMATESGVAENAEWQERERKWVKTSWTDCSRTWCVVFYGVGCRVDGSLRENCLVWAAVGHLLPTKGFFDFLA